MFLISFLFFFFNTVTCYSGCCEILSLLYSVYVTFCISRYLVSETELLSILWILSVFQEVKSRSGNWEVREWSPKSTPAALAEVAESELQGKLGRPGCQRGAVGEGRRKALDVPSAVGLLVNSVSSWKEELAVEWQNKEGTRQHLCLSFPWSHHGHLQRKITATPLPPSTSHTNFFLDDFYCWSITGILGNVVPAYRCIYILTPLLSTFQSVAFKFHFLNLILSG